MSYGAIWGDVTERTLALFVNGFPLPTMMFELNVTRVELARESRDPLGLKEDLRSVATWRAESGAVFGESGGGTGKSRAV